MYQIRKIPLLATITFALVSGVAAIPGTAIAHTDLVCATQCYHGGGGTTQQCAAKCVGHVHGGGGGGTEPASEDKTTDSDDKEESNPVRGQLSYKKLPQ